MKQLVNALYVLLLVISPAAIPVSSNAQSPDTRICNCLSASVGDNFMDGTKVVYGRVGLFVKREEELKPAQDEKVRFTLPVLRPKSGCGAVYHIIITNAAGLPVFESQDSQPQFEYQFDQCGERYEVTVVAKVQSPGGNDGNCSWSRHFYVRPNCNNQTCPCDPAPTAKNRGTSVNMNLEGKMVCGVTTATQRTYNFQYRLKNKTACRMVIEAVSIVGQVQPVASLALVPGGESSNFSMVISTPLSQAPPTGSSVYVTVRYKVKDRACTATLKIPYEACKQ